MFCKDGEDYDGDNSMNMDNFADCSGGTNPFNSDENFNKFSQQELPNIIDGINCFQCYRI